MTEGAEDLVVTLSAHAGDAVEGYVDCKLAWAGGAIAVTCDVPAVTRAGYWILEATLGGVTILDGSRAVAVAGAVADQSYVVLGREKPVLGQIWQGAVVYPLDVEGVPAADSGAQAFQVEPRVMYPSTRVEGSPLLIQAR